MVSLLFAYCDNINCCSVIALMLSLRAVAVCVHDVTTVLFGPVILVGEVALLFLLYHRLRRVVLSEHRFG